MNLICKMTHGSTLYGLETENSDVDYKGIYIPSLEDMILGKESVTKQSSTGEKDQKNQSGDIDEQYFSLQKFIEMACAGETVAIDMLHCNDKNLISSSPLWDELVSMRAMFYTTNMKAFLGYCKKQAAKYGIKGSRLSALESVVNKLKYAMIDHGEDCKLKDPVSCSMVEIIHNEDENHKEHVKLIDGFYKKDKWIDKQMIDVCGSKFEMNTSVSHVLNSIQAQYDQYGKRAKLAKENKGVDWKAVSHAIRAAYQLKEIYETGDLKYPLAGRELILDIKLGKLDYIDEVQPLLDSLIDEVEDLSETVDLPKKADVEFFKWWTVSSVEREILGLK